MESNYYADSLNSMHLYQVYQTEIDRVNQYLASEINFIRDHVHSHENAMELGAGYGRVMKELAPFLNTITGIDISKDTVEFGQHYLNSCDNCVLKCMDAHNLQFDRQFDVILCLQNGLSSLKGDAFNLVEQVVALLSPNGRAYFSSYSAKFWVHRLAWFQEQADKGLLGEIDLAKTQNGQIVCRDGFVATTCSPSYLEELGKASGCTYQIIEVNESSIFLILEKTLLS